MASEYRTRRYWRSYSGLGGLLTYESQRPLVSTKQIRRHLACAFPNGLGAPKESRGSAHEGKETRTPHCSLDCSSLNLQSHVQSDRVCGNLGATLFKGVKARPRRQSPPRIRRGRVPAAA